MVKISIGWDGNADELVLTLKRIIAVAEGQFPSQGASYQLPDPDPAAVAPAAQP